MAETNTIEYLLKGTSGFALATIIFGLFYWKVLLPKTEKLGAQVEKLAEADTLLVIAYMDKDKSNGVDIAELIKKLKQ